MAHRLRASVYHVNMCLYMDNSTSHAGHSWRLKRTVRALTLIVMVGIIVIAGLACQSSPNPQQAEQCDREKGEIYDFRTGNCTRPQSSDDAFALSAYNVARGAAEESNVRVLLYDVSFVKPLVPNELGSLLLDQRIVSVEMLSLSFPAQGGSLFFSEPIPTATKKSEAVSASIARARAILEEAPDKSDFAALKEIDTAVTNNTFTTTAARLRLRASDVPGWWKDNITVVKAAMLLERQEAAR